MGIRWPLKGLCAQALREEPVSRGQQELLSGAGLRVLPLHVRGVQALCAARHVPPVGRQSHRRHAAVHVTGRPRPAALQRAALRSPDGNYFWPVLSRVRPCWTQSWRWLNWTGENYWGATSPKSPSLSHRMSFRVQPETLISLAFGRNTAS